VVAAVAALWGAACAGELDHPERFADCPPGYVEQLFQESCGGAGACHDDSEPEANLDLVSPGVGDRLLGIPSVQTECGDVPMIDPAGGDHLLLQKLRDAPPCGARMPFGKAKLDAADVECVRRWIDDTVAAGGGA